MFKPRSGLRGSYGQVAESIHRGGGAARRRRGVLYSVFVAPGIEQAQRSAIEDCHRAARMVYDVHWAAACMTQAGQASSDYAEGHAECELPDDKAAVVNAWLDEAEKRCMAEVRAGLGP